MPKLLSSVRRFPVSVALILGFASVLFVEITLDLGGVFSYRLHIFLAFGAIIGTAAALWLEDFVSGAKFYIITAVITLLWGVYIAIFCPRAILVFLSCLEAGLTRAN